MSGRPGPHTAGDDGVLLHELIAGHARSRPDAPAVTCGGRTLTYRRLDAEAERLAAGLRARVHGENAVIAVLMDRSTELVVTLLGILKAGCAYLALSTTDPDPRLAELAADAGARLAVTTPDLAGRLPGTLEILTSGTAPGGTGPAENDPPAAGTGDARPAAHGARTADDLAYVCYTSGSTGAPKGVGVTHRGVHRLAVLQDWLRLTPQDVVLQVSSVSFDASTLEIFGALCAGCRLVVHPGGGPIDLDALAATVTGHEVTVVNLATGLLHRLIESRLSVFAGLRHVVTGGDVASPALVTRLLRAWPALTFTNGYGPTENTTFTTRWTTTGTPPPGPVPLGRAVSGTAVAVLDDAMDPVAAGGTGEIYTWGEGLARGYLGRPAATAERFLPCPFGPPGSRMYRTGDLARLPADGELEFAGRTDRQVKVRGYRVEPGAVEAALVRQPGVDRAVVVVERDDAGHTRLVAHVVPGDTADTELGPRLRADLAAGLPAYAVPDAVLVHTTLPVTAHGKVDRDALTGRGPRPRTVSNAYIAPLTPLQRRLTELWSALLDTAPVGIEDDFFDLGGHSLLAAELLDVMHQELGVEIPATALYLRSTVAELGEAVGEALAGREKRP
ncbi:amino acid adenylation domain-containing protein [Streptomyces sp. NPDC090083]|uniref:non-ribosomal peptide synthetase n=1 Tax=Streptomyces sp. NPDC090083 TaxID=3365941 RepID=UPI00382E7905